MNWFQLISLSVVDRHKFDLLSFLEQLVFRNDRKPQKCPSPCHDLPEVCHRVLLMEVITTGWSQLGDSRKKYINNMSLTEDEDAIFLQWNIYPKL